MTDFTALKIPPDQWQSLCDRDPIAPFVLDGVQGIYFRQRQYWLPLCITEGSLLLLILMVVLPVVLVVADTQNLDSTIASHTLLQITLGIAGLVWVGVNGILVYRGRQLLPIAQLRDRIEHYNQIIAALEFTAQFPTATPPTADETLQQTLITIRASLLKRIQIEQLSRDRRQLHQHHLIIAQLDAQLDELLRLDTEPPTTAAAQLLQEALALGLAIHREVRAWQKRSNL